MKINTMYFNFLSLAELYQFIRRVLALVEKIGADKLKITAQVDNILRSAFEKLQQIYHHLNGSTNGRSWSRREGAEKKTSAFFVCSKSHFVPKTHRISSALGLYSKKT